MAKKKANASASSKKFKGLLVQKRARVMGDVKQLEDKRCTIRSAISPATCPTTVSTWPTSVPTRRSVKRCSTLRRRNRNSCDKISRALERIDQGNYGECQLCGAEIRSERLEILPESTVCMKCMRKVQPLETMMASTPPVPRRGGRSPRLEFAGVIAVAILLGDQLSKAWIRGALPLGSADRVVIPGMLALTHRLNPGVAFSFFRSFEHAPLVFHSSPPARLPSSGGCSFVRRTCRAPWCWRWGRLPAARRGTLSTGSGRRITTRLHRRVRRPVSLARVQRGRQRDLHWRAVAAAGGINRSALSGALPPSSSDQRLQTLNRKLQAGISHV